MTFAFICILLSGIGDLCGCFSCGLFRCYILIFPHTHFSPRKNEHMLSFPPGKMSIYWDYPPEKWVYTEFSPRKSKYVLTHTHFSPHTSFSPLLFNRVFLIFMYMVEDIIVKCGRKRVSTMIIVITKASMNMEWDRIRRSEERMGKTLEW